ncbi:PP2C family protein-serine/threonine phosphatase [Fodinicola feengrottensis]|uniref:Protein phosphatase 2C domain-containing protein n=1 Tax=Fodinicola feengrottensis TaxID=435914 RepID=A0ABN2GWU9_9ACTN|nr:PP2C family serine/threonine-protein phosphatase [Fodinicola feengrottensis]
MSLTLRYAAKSDRGLIREGNEDSVYAGPRLLAVADGMGGMAAGEVASNIVVAALAPLDEDAPGADLVDALKNAVADANDQLRRAVEDNSALEGMGTTLTAMLFSGNRLAVVHVGDSRAYVYRDGDVNQITRDDTYVQMLVDEGRITQEEAGTHPQRSLLTRALDGRDVDPDFSVREAVPGDRYLLCSDGLTVVVSEETIGETMGLQTPAQVADRLVSLALRAGAPDNVTVIVADIMERETGDDAPVVGGAAARDRGRASGARPDSAAGRAALARPHPAVEEDDEEDDDPAPPRHRVRTTLLVVAALIVVAAIGFGGWTYTQNQYYVGATTDGHVAIFRGVRGTVAGIGLSRLSSESDIVLTDLQPVAARSVSEGITAQDASDAEAIVKRLRDQLKPLCAPIGQTGTDPVRPGGSPSPHPGGTPSPHPGGSPSPHPSVSQSPSPTPSPSTPPADSTCRPR